MLAEISASLQPILSEDVRLHEKQENFASQSFDGGTKLNEQVSDSDSCY